MKYTKEFIEDKIKLWVDNNLQGFIFREHQFETITNIIYNISNNLLHTQVIEAPTGIGKSIIIIISSGVLSESPFNKNSYILCSDLFLWEQYASFIIKNKINFGYIKGQTGNYCCKLNDQDIKNSECRIEKIPWFKLMDKNLAKHEGYDCAIECEYIKDRKRALESKVTLMTYQLFLYQTGNKDRRDKDQNGFKTRNIIFCDECHNIPSIVQNKFSPTISKDTFNKLKSIYMYVFDNQNNLNIFDINEESQLINTYKSWNEMNKKFEYLFNIFTNEHSTEKELFDNIHTYFELITNLYLPEVTNIQNKLSNIKTKNNHKPISKEQLDIFKLTSWFNNHLCYIEDFEKSMSNIGCEYLIRQINLNNKTGEISSTFNCAKEDYIIYKYLLDKSDYRVLLSATVGGKESYFDNIGTKYLINPKLIKTDEIHDYNSITNYDNNCINTDIDPEEEPNMENISSTFDFTKSPIYVFNKFKMSYYEKSKSFPKIKEMIYEICNKMHGKHGIIQTGSYSNAKSIFYDAPNNIKQRLLLYNDSKEKESCINEHKFIDDSILLGPTLNEGIDLPGDLCSFIIISKVPYPSLTDKLVKKKIELFPKWYESTTSNEIIQGIGRGNRYKEDSCITFILDACFIKLYNDTKGQYSEELQKRIKFI